MTEAQFAEGFAYAEENFLNEQAEHLKLDKALIRKKFNLNNKNVLDFGCGMGGMSLWYGSQWNCKVRGLDIDGHHIKIAKAIKEKHQVPNVSFEQRNILDDPIDEKFDMIFMNDVIEHIQIDIVEVILEKLYEHLADDGSLFVTYPPWKSPYASHLNPHISIPWVQFLPKSVLYNLIEKNNVKIVGDLEGDLRSAYDGLNHMTHKKLKSVTGKIGFKQASRSNHCMLNKLPGMKL